MAAPDRLRIVLLTGMSGSGKSTAIRALEDAGWFCIDNLPVVLVPKLLELVSHGGGDEVHRLALVIDAREGPFLERTPQAVEEVRKGAAQIAFLLKPTSVQQVADTSFSGGVMPQKSTDFYPKLLSGMVMYKLD